MTERHPAGARADARGVMTRAADALPPRYYDPARGRAEPPAVTAARERRRALAFSEAMPDPAPGYEWYRELADD